MRQATARVAFLAAALGLAGCASTQDASEMFANPREFFNLNPPVVVRGSEVEGQRVTLARGQALVVTLDGDVGAGRRWEMQRYDGPTIMAPVRHDLAAKPGASPGAAGGVGDATFRLRGIAAGTQPVVIEYKGAFEAAAAKTLRFDVVVL